MPNRNLWAQIVLIIVGFSFWIPTTSATVRALPFFLLCTHCIILDKYWQVKRKRIWYFLLVGSILTLAFHGFWETKDLILFFTCFCGISYMSEQFVFKPKYLYIFFIFFILPSSVYQMMVVGDVTWIPHEGVINILGGDTTKHGTAIAGVLLLLPSLFYLFERHKGLTVEYSTKKLLFLLILALYLVVFSSSRSVTLSVIALIVYLYINRKQFKKNTSIFIFITCNLSVFFMEYLSDYAIYIEKKSWLADFVHIDNFEQHGVTSGRSWLWDVHIRTFFSSPWLMGGGRAFTDFTVGDWIPWLGMKAKAGGESVYTGYLSCYGLVGVGFIVVQLGLFFDAVRKKALLASAIMFFMIYNTTMGTSFTTPYFYDGVLFYFLYFAYLHKRRSCALV